MEIIKELKLKNQGGFVVKLDFVYKLDDIHTKRISGDRKDITLGKSKTLNPGDYGVPEGSICTVHADVVAGKDKEGRSWFQYSKTGNLRAKFTISGTTLDNELGFNGTELIEE